MYVDVTEYSVAVFIVSFSLSHLRSLCRSRSLSLSLYLSLLLASSAAWLSKRASERVREREREGNRAAKDKQKDQRKMGKATWRMRGQDRRGRGRVWGFANVAQLPSLAFSHAPSYLPYPISFPRQFPSVNSIIYRYTLRRRPLFRFSLFPLIRCHRLHRRLFNLIGVLLPPPTSSCFLSRESTSSLSLSLLLPLTLLLRNYYLLSSAEDGERQGPLWLARLRTTNCERMQDHFWDNYFRGPRNPQGRCLSSEIADGKIFDAGDSDPAEKNTLA